jgi:hypothetical protein
MKICISCNTEKPLDDFQKRSSAKDGYTGTCKPCKREYDNKYYLNNPNRKTYITKNRKKAKQDAEAYILEYLLSHPCIDCGETDPIVLEFDHVSGIKKEAISTLKRNGLKSIIEEIQKCEVRCANCHRRKTAKQFGWKNKVPC